MRPERRVRWAAILIPGLGLFFALLFAAQNYYRGVILGSSPDSRNILIESLTRWLLYALLAPLAGLMVDRIPLGRTQLSFRLGVHTLAALAFAVAHSALMGLVYGLLHVYPRGSTLGEAMGRLFLVYSGLNFVIYWALCGAYHAVRYQSEMRNRELLAMELKSSLTAARLEALRAQLNPHFLFNTLHAISVLAQSGQNEAVVSTLHSLGDLLRVSLDRNLSQEIPLDKELEILEGYLQIQRTRFGDRLTVSLEIAPETRTALVPTMILQPLVENALQHGISSRTGPGQVTVRACLDGPRLRLRVEDSGPGFRDARGDTGAVSGAGAGIGLSNTRARLEQLYGEEQSLESGNLPGSGAFVEVMLPHRGIAQAESA
jgi:signal transduction histidine kinase